MSYNNFKYINFNPKSVDDLDSIESGRIMFSNVDVEDHLSVLKPNGQVFDFELGVIIGDGFIQLPDEEGIEWNVSTYSKATIVTDTEDRLVNIIGSQNGVRSTLKSNKKLTFNHPTYTTTDGVVSVEFDETFNEGGNGFDNQNLGPTLTQVHSIGFQSDGKIICGGAFTSYNDKFGTHSCYRIARLNTDGTFDTTFNNVSNPGFNYTSSESVSSTPSSYEQFPDVPFFVRHLDIQDDDKILVVGAFDNYNNTGGGLYRGIIRLNNDGSIDNTFNISPGFEAPINVYKVKYLSTGKILVCGGFTEYNGTNISGICRLNSDGTLDTTFNNSGIGQTLTSEIRTFDIQSDGKIIIAFSNGSGSNTYYDGTSNVIPLQQLVIRLNADGTYDNTFNQSTFNQNNPSSGYKIEEIKVLPDDRIVVSGEFYYIDGIEKSGKISILSPNGGVTDLVNVNVVMNIGNQDSGINAIDVDSDGLIYYGADSITTFNDWQHSGNKNFNRFDSNQPNSKSTDYFGEQTFLDFDFLIGGNQTSYDSNNITIFSNIFDLKIIEDEGKDILYLAGNISKSKVNQWNGNDYVGSLTTDTNFGIVKLNVYDPRYYYEVIDDGAEIIVYEKKISRKPTYTYDLIGGA
jgi:uncharacterized delta-60 repeat protein